MSGEFANLNELWSRTIAETMRSKGVQFAIVCPGSRSSPLAFAMARTKGIEAISVLDERSAAFFALGIAKRERAPVAVICTSGTAAANFFPAVIEASECGVPLILLTADRPPELRDCRAGQTIDQVRLYGMYPVSQVELALPENEISMLRYLRQTIATHVDRSLSPCMGPVHVNVPFRDPLPPIGDRAYTSSIRNEEWNRFFSRLNPSRALGQVSELDLKSFADTSRGLLLIGSPLAGTSEEWLDNVATFASHLNWPLLADGLNPVRNHANRFPYLITGYNAITRIELSKTRLLPEKVIVIGDLPISKSLRNWLGRQDVETLFLGPFFREFDSNRGNSESRYFDFNQSIPVTRKQKDTAFAEAWKKVEEQFCSLTTERLENPDTIFEGDVARTLSRSLPRESALFVSNSMPPRDLDLFWEANDREIEVYSSRGANGIDGILSTALGVAHRGKPTFLLTGDLALLHDSNGGLVSKQFAGSLTIILINNNGGGIFEMLPVSQFGAEFETLFATDQKVDFSKWAATYDIEYRKAESLADLADCIRMKPRSGVRLVEVATDRKRDAAERKRLIAEIASRLTFD